MIKIAGLGAGFFFLGLSLLSFVVPVLPTVPLLIVTCFLFSRSSPRWHAWLLGRKRLGPPLKLWEEQGAIETRVKIMTTTIMTAFLFYPIFLGEFSLAARLWTGGCALGVFAFLWTRPTPEPIGRRVLNFVLAAALLVPLFVAGSDVLADQTVNLDSKSCLDQYRPVRPPAEGCRSIHDGTDYHVFYPVAAAPKGFPGAFSPGEPLLKISIARYDSEPCSKTYRIKKRGRWVEVSNEVFCGFLIEELRKCKGCMRLWVGGCC